MRTAYKSTPSQWWWSQYELLLIYYYNIVAATVSLWFLVFAGFACNYMIRINLNIAIVDMTTAKSGGRSILMCGNSTGGLNLTVGRDVVVKKVIRNQFVTRLRCRWCVYNGHHCFYCYFRQISSGKTVNGPAYLDRFIGCIGHYSYQEGCSRDNSVLSAYLALAICSCSSCPC